MFRATLRRLSGGHGDLFPTSKEAAHLAPKWVLSRPAPAPPGKGRAVAHHAHGQVAGKFQLATAAHSSEHVVPVETTFVTKEQRAAGAVHGLSPAAVVQTLRGVHDELATAGGHGHGHGHGHDHAHGHAAPARNAVAEQNVREKEESEEAVRRYDPDSLAHKPDLRTMPIYTRQKYCPLAAQEYMAERTVNVQNKCVDLNPRGYEKEWFPWEDKPPAPPKTEAKK